jgi:matrixin/carboxypeptidase family protein
MKRVGSLLVCLACLMTCAPRLHAYLKLGTTADGRTVSAHWSRFPIRYFVANRGVTGVTPTQFQQTIARAFSTWDSVDGVSLSSDFAGFTSASPLDDDSVSVLGFVNRPDLDRVLGSTSFTFDIVSGEIVESDIFFNSSFPWSVAGGGETDRFDLESIAVHEIGHLHGLGHSALGETELRAGGRRVLGAEAVMFPIAFSAGTTLGRTLHADDVAGIVDLYAADAARRSTGSISGRVTKNGTGVAGAHVVAFNPSNGKLVGGFTLGDDGSFVIAGLDPGPQVLRAEPLDDADIDSFFDASLDVDVNFTPAFSTRLIVVPRGGTARNVEIKVVAK